MKKIFTSAMMVVLAALLFSSCVKERVVVVDNSYWLTQERGDVVYSSNNCGYYVVETNYGYTIIRNTTSLNIYSGDIMYGNFGGYGTRDFYNYTANAITRGSVVEYDLSYTGAQNALDYYCPYGKGAAPVITKSATADNKVKRP